MYNDWFSVDVKKRASRVRSNPLGHILKELVANSLDANAKNINLTIKVTPNTKANRVGMRSFTFACSDDGDGCNDPEILRRIGSSTQDLHAETRGRFGQGLIDVICVCDSAEIETMRHRIDFDADGCKVWHHKDMIKGMYVSGIIRHDGEGFDDIEQYFASFIIDANFTLNGKTLQRRNVVRSIPEVHLQTAVYSSDKAKVCKMRRNTTVQISEMHFSNPMVYEMGIPVDTAPWSLPYDINVMQKTPLDVERNMLPDAYKKSLINSIVGNVSDLYVAYMKSSDNVPVEISNDRDNAEKLSDDAKSLIVEKVVGCSIDKIVGHNMEFCSEVERLSGRLARWVAEHYELWNELEEKFFCKKEEILQEVA